MTLSPEAHIAHIRADAHALLAAARAEPDAPVPSCPGWTRTKLVKHLCVALGWAVAQAEAGPDDPKVFRDAARPAEGEDVLDFFEGVVDRTVSALGAIDMTATFPTWLGPRPGAWVARRMAHETAIHRWDAAGGAFDAALAIDGIDELLDELAPLDHLAERLDGTTSTVHLHSTDSDDGEWLVTFGPERITSERVHGKGDAAVRGSASNLYLFAWNRVPLDDRFEVFGDRAAAERWSQVISL
ncbi:MAG TPA: maleylpyruvate isomerase N-terminal domain-containing protein [Acidimicrobiales bacterium]